MNKLPVDTEEFWKARIEKSKEYGDIHHSVYISRTSLWRDIEEAHREVLAKEIPPGSKVLDAGCGYGRCAEWFHYGDYTGVDFSPDFIHLASLDYPSSAFVQADLKNLLFEDLSFDVAFCISMKQMIIGNLGEASWEEIQQELKRVAKKVLILEYEEPEKYEIL